MKKGTGYFLSLAHLVRRLFPLKKAACPLFFVLAGGPAFGQQQTVRFTTADGCGIEAFYLAPSSGAYVLINAHGLGSSKNEWAPFQQALKKAGYGYLSLDLRGHNGSASCGGKKADHKSFTKENWAAASRDIEAGAAFLKKKGVPPARMIYCGASVGANLALKAAAEGPLKPAGLILLSPGIEYAGVRTDETVAAVGGTRLLLAASSNDPYAWQSAGFLLQKADAAGGTAEFMDGGGGHGVNMFKAKATLPAILSWLGRK
jgi:pimeloyl-ACP methyl ester carboxylesterase